MSDASSHNFDFNRMIYKAISTYDLPSALAKTPFPAFFACLFKSSFTPSKDSAILCEPFSPKSRFFLDTPKFYTLYAGSPNVPPRVLAVWAKTLRGQQDEIKKKKIRTQRRIQIQFHTITMSNGRIYYEKKSYKKMKTANSY